MTRSTRRARGTALIAGTMLILSACTTGGGGSTSVGANLEGAELFSPGEGRISSEALREHAYSSLRGKTLAFVPIGFGLPLTDEWSFVLESRAKEFGMNYITRDPNLNPAAQAQAVTALVAQNPDVMILHNPDVELLASQIEQAQRQGIYVIQINMVSNYKSDAYVGADWIRVGRMVGEQIVKDCGPGTGTSGKVQIIEGPKTSAASLNQVEGVMSVLNQYPEIKVVSDQSAGNWNAAAARELGETVLRAHPDLCAMYGLWDVMVYGAAQVVRDRGLLDQVHVYSEGDQSPIACQAIAEGLIDFDVTYSDPLQAQQMFDTASLLLQSGLQPGTLHVAHYSPLEVWTKDNVTPDDCYVPGQTLP